MRSCLQTPSSTRMRHDGSGCGCGSGRYGRAVPRHPDRRRLITSSTIRAQSRYVHRPDEHLGRFVGAVRRVPLLTERRGGAGHVGRRHLKEPVAFPACCGSTLSGARRRRRNSSPPKRPTARRNRHTVPVDVIPTFLRPRDVVGCVSSHHSTTTASGRSEERTMLGWSVSAWMPAIVRGWYVTSDRSDASWCAVPVLIRPPRDGRPSTAISTLSRSCNEKLRWYLVGTAHVPIRYRQIRTGSDGGATTTPPPPPPSYHPAVP